MAIRCYLVHKCIQKQYDTYAILLLFSFWRMCCAVDEQSSWGVHLVEIGVSDHEKQCGSLDNHISSSLCQVPFHRHFESCLMVNIQSQSTAGMFHVA